MSDNVSGLPGQNNDLVTHVTLPKGKQYLQASTRNPYYVMFQMHWLVQALDLWILHMTAKLTC